MTTSEARRIVNRGVKLLDTYAPGWAKKVNLKKFALDDPDMCVLGQTHRAFDKGLQDIAEKAIGKELKKLTSKVELSGYTTDELSSMISELEIDSNYYGFNADGNEEFEALSNQWVRIITKRQSQES